jgi:hypothetical protein
LSDSRKRGANATNSNQYANEYFGRAMSDPTAGAFIICGIHDLLNDLHTQPRRNNVTPEKRKNGNCNHKCKTLAS